MADWLAGNQWYKAKKGPVRLDMSGAPGRDWCYSYSAPLDTPSLECGGVNWSEWGPLNWWNPTCEGWHYGNQAWGSPNGPFGANITFWNSNGVYMFAGPLQGGIFGCERYNVAHTIFIGNSPFASEIAALDVVKIIPPIFPLPELNPDTAPALDPLPRDNPAYRPRRMRKLKPYELPAMELQVEQQPSGRTRARFNPNSSHKRVPPSKGESEDKGNVPTRGIPAIYGGFTEFVDFIDALNKALPKDKRIKGQATIIDKVANLMTNWRHIDPYDAALEVLFQHYQDKAIGRAGQYGQKATENLAKKGYWKSIRGISISRPGATRVPQAKG